MSRFLSIECDPIDQPAATDHLERRTWSALQIRVEGRIITRIWDRTLDRERATLYVPVFPIAEWIVQNWWALLNEPCRTDRTPKSTAAHPQLLWIKRHCLRAAESGLLLPSFYLYHDGRQIRAEWQADEQGALPNMLGEFLDSGSACLDGKSTKDALSEFVNEVLGRVNGTDEERAVELKANWQAIQSTDADEAEFCGVAGRMGVDPYDPSHATDSLADFIERSLGDPDLPLARDLTEVAETKSVAAQWSWVQDTRNRLHLGPKSKPTPFKGSSPISSPAKLGYRLANDVRHIAGLDEISPLQSLTSFASDLISAEFRIEESNHVPGNGVRSLVGWSSSGAIVAGPQPSRSDSRRFHIARALYHALFACDRTARLVTNAFTWDQRVSRAFAAELLAPQKALVARTQGSADSSMVEQLAREFDASTVLIEKQLENTGVILAED